MDLCCSLNMRNRLSSQGFRICSSVYLESSAFRYSHVWLPNCIQVCNQISNCRSSVSTTWKIPPSTQTSNPQPTLLFFIALYVHLKWYVFNCLLSFFYFRYSISLLFTVMFPVLRIMSDTETYSNIFLKV